MKKNHILHPILISTRGLEEKTESSLSDYLRVCQIGDMDFNALEYEFFISSYSFLKSKYNDAEIFKLFNDLTRHLGWISHKSTLDEFQEHFATIERMYPQQSQQIIELIKNYIQHIYTSKWDDKPRLYNPELLNIARLINTSDENLKTPKENIKYTAKEYALAYILELFSEGKQVPVRRAEGGLNKKYLESIGVERTNRNYKPSTFYDAVKNVLPIVSNNKKEEFKHLSNDWLNAVREISNNNPEVEKYLKKHDLI